MCFNFGFKFYAVSHKILFCAKFFAHKIFCLWLHEKFSHAAFVRVKTHRSVFEIFFCGVSAAKIFCHVSFVRHCASKRVQIFLCGVFCALRTSKRVQKFFGVSAFEIFVASFSYDTHFDARPNFFGVSMCDSMAEWLRRQIRNLVGVYPRGFESLCCRIVSIHHRK